MAGPLTPPPERSDRDRIIEVCELMIEEGIEDLRSARDHGHVVRPSHLGVEYDEGFAQGRKDACRVILLTLGVEGVGMTSRDEL